MEDHYHILFEPPKIKALCDQVVIVYYDTEELKIYESVNFSVELQRESVEVVVWCARF